METICMYLTPANKAYKGSLKEIHENSKEGGTGPSIFDRAVAYANGSTNFKRGKKSMRIMDICDGHLFISLSSAVSLQQAPRSFAGFSRELLRLAKAQGVDLQPLIYNNTLFRYAPAPSGQQTVHERADGMTDVEAVKRCVELFFGNRPTMTKEEREKTEERKRRIKEMLADEMPCRQ